jgi:hypothetical protein
MILHHSIETMLRARATATLWFSLLATSLAAYVTRPDIIPIAWDVTYTAANASDSLAPGYVFIAPRTVQPGNLAIFNGSNGQLVWYSTPYEVANGGGGGGGYDLHPQTYNDEPVLTYWAGRQAGGNGYGNITVLAQNYSTLANVSAPGVGSDMHETRLTRNNTLLSTLYNTTDGVDASMLTTGLQDSWVLDACFYELQLPSGTPLYQWCASKNGITADESFLGIPTSPTQDAPWDWMHPNSVNKDDLGNYLFSLRHAHMAVYVSGVDGSILWRLGGMNSNFSGQGANFSWQHDVQWVQDPVDQDVATLAQIMQNGTRRLSIFDNASNATVNNATESRGMLVELDFANKTATLITEYSHPNGEVLLASSQCNTQFMNNGLMDDLEVEPKSTNVLMGYGYLPVFAEYSLDGTPLQVTHFGDMGEIQSYRVYKAPWIGKPTTKPVVAVDNNGTAYASWNGATEVFHWHFLVSQNGTDQQNNTAQVNATTDRRDQQYAGYYVRKNSFETAVGLNVTEGQSVFVRALDSQGSELARSIPLLFNGTGSTTWSPGYDGYYYSSNDNNATATSSNASAVTATILSTGTNTATATATSTSTSLTGSASTNRVPRAVVLFYSGLTAVAMTGLITWTSY